MAKELTITALCDLCLQGEERVTETSEYDITINSARAILDLCAEHACTVQLVQDSLALGSKPEPTATRRRRRRSNSNGGSEVTSIAPHPRQSLEDDEHRCPICDAMSKSRPALNQHTRKRHGMGFRELREAGYVI